MTPPRTRRGISLLELVVAVALFAVALGIGFSVTRAARTRTGLKARAQQVLADLRWARQRAMTLGRPCGLLLPEATVTRVYAVVATDAEAPERFFVERVVECQEGSESSALFSGSWNGLPFSTEPVSLDARVDGGAILQMAAWSRQYPGRYLLFGANGIPITNALPHADGSRFLVLGAGLGTSGDALSAAGPSYTIRLSALGDGRIEQGIPGFPTSPDPPQATPPTAALPRGLPRAGAPRGRNHPPKISDLAVTPLANMNVLPADAVADRTFQVRTDGSLVLTVTATDPDGDRLSCTWGGHLQPHAAADSAPSPESASNHNLTPGVGAWSTTGPQPMTWDTPGAAWTQVVEWAPPASAVPGQWYALGVLVDDLRGGQAARWIVVQIIEPDPAAIAIQRGESYNTQVLLSNVAFSEVTSLPKHSHPHMVGSFMASDTTTLLLSSVRTGKMFNVETREETELSTVSAGMPQVTIWDTSGDGVHFGSGTNRTQVGGGTVRCWDESSPIYLSRGFGWLRFSPAGRAAGTYTSNEMHRSMLQVADPRTGTFTQALPYGPEIRCLTWISDLPGRIVYCEQYGYLHIATEGEGGWTKTSTPVARLDMGGIDFRWSASQQTLIWKQGWDGPLKYLRIEGDMAVGSPQEIPGSAVTVYEPVSYALSPDGSRILYITEQGLDLYDFRTRTRRHVLDDVNGVAWKRFTP